MSRAAAAYPSRAVHGANSYLTNKKLTRGMPSTTLVVAYLNKYVTYGAQYVTYPDVYVTYLVRYVAYFAESAHKRAVICSKFGMITSVFVEFFHAYARICTIFGAIFIFLRSW